METKLSLKNDFYEFNVEVNKFIDAIKNSRSLAQLLENSGEGVLSTQYSMLYFLVNSFPDLFEDYLDFFKYDTVYDFFKETYEDFTERCDYEIKNKHCFPDLISLLSFEIKDKMALIKLKISEYETYEISIIETLIQKDSNDYVISLTQNIREQLSNQLKDLEDLWISKKYSDCFIKAEGFLKTCIKSIAGELNIKIDKINKGTKKDDYKKLLNDIFSTIMSTQNKSVENIFGFIKTSFEQIILPVRNFFKTENYDKKEVKEFNQRSVNEQNLYCRFYIDLCKLISNVLLVIANKESS